MITKIKIKYWSDKFQAGLNSIKECYAIVDGEFVKMNAEVSTASLRYRYKKKVIYYSNLKKNLNIKNKIIQEYSPF